MPRRDMWLLSCSLDEERTAVLAGSPRAEDRLAVVENGNADPAALTVLARDAEPRVRFLYAMLAHEFGRRLPDDVLDVLADDSEVRVRRTTAWLDLPLDARIRLLRDEDAGVRAAAIGPETWPLLPASVREELLADPEPEVQEALAALRPRVPEASPEPALPAEARLADPDPRVRRAAVEDPEIPAELALRLAADPENSVRLALSMRADLAPEQRSAIAYVVPSGYHSVPRWIEERGHEPEVARRAAASGHVLLRRSIAMQERLPADVVDLLAADEDFFVKLTLCEYGDKAPHDLVVEMYAYWHGLKWGFLRSHANFARPGLARYVDHPNPRLRVAALDDPEAGPDVVMRLVDDPDAGASALRDARLPPDELRRRLAVPGSAQHAAANPTLPEAVMHELLDLAGVPAAVEAP
ncbi:hypothetical protein [Streptomyces sp. AN091965]|uniref:hypothetical protein n=1 Tax=Streptomyces sp. AN091965 TaxID=2927803 RepID=UPI001F6204C8|nr:hypothetical protein [Streptomyces sp. AN091965]MCI3928413.1 hypothetical protein [Streptomyces sp. AN091965]